jgi:hypothetical protein
MGKSDGDNDLFWQLFVSRGSGNHWTLVTPPGVADNGGLVTATNAAGTTALIGFGASQGLDFSPLAMTSTAGKTWNQGGLTEALTPVPSAVTLGTGGRALALVRGSEQSVLTRSGNLTDWKTLVTQEALSATPAGKSCGIASLDAVGFDQSNVALVGASCRRPDTPGVFMDSDSEWHLADIPIPNGLVDDSFAVARLNASSALFLAGHEKTTSLVAAWEPSIERPWVLSPPLRLGATDHLVASGNGPGATQFVLIRNADATRVDIVTGPGATWRQLPNMPLGTQTITVGTDGHLQALAVNDTKLIVWQLDTGTIRWTKVQSITVPIVFGSSD